jgi:hypothetical protein
LPRTALVREQQNQNIIDGGAQERFLLHQQLSSVPKKGFCCCLLLSEFSTSVQQVEAAVILIHSRAILYNEDGLMVVYEWKYEDKVRATATIFLYKLQLTADGKREKKKRRTRLNFTVK